MESGKIISWILVLVLAGMYGASGQSTAEKSHATEVQWYSLEEAQQLAGENDKKVLIFVEAVWCTFCKKMDREVFTRNEIQTTMAEYFYPVRVDLESGKLLRFNEEKMTEREFSMRMRVSSTPTHIFVDRDGSVLGVQPGFVPGEIYKALLSYIGTDAHKEIEFEKYLEESKGTW